MNKINNLNLEYLRVLNSILDTKSATLSAKSLGVTQSAISHSLKKLREILGDELVYRQGNSMELTARAQALKIPLKKWINQLGPILSTEEFDPKSSNKVFYIATTDIVEHLFAPELIKILQTQAPNIQVRFLRWEYEKIESMLDNSQIDLAIGVRSFDSSNILQRVLYNETFISIARKGHPLLSEKINLENFLSYPHVMTGPGDGKGAIDNYLERLNRKRKLLYTVNSFSSAPTLVENSDCILTAPKRFMDYSAKRHKVEVFKTPIRMNEFSIKVYWSKKNQNEAANKWMRDLFYNIADKNFS